MSLWVLLILRDASRYSFAAFKMKESRERDPFTLIRATLLELKLNFSQERGDRISYVEEKILWKIHLRV